MPAIAHRRSAIGALALMLTIPLGLGAAPASAAEAPAAKTVAQLKRDWNSLNGLRLRPVGEQGVYVIIDGKRRGIPDGPTYDNLFGNRNILDVIDIHSIPDGGHLSSGAILATSPSSDTIWLISNGIKRGITGPAFEKYEFDWSKIRMLRDIVLNSIPQGPNIGL